MPLAITCGVLKELSATIHSSHIGINKFTKFHSPFLYLLLITSSCPCLGSCLHESFRINHFAVQYITEPSSVRRNRSLIIVLQLSTKNLTNARSLKLFRVHGSSPGWQQESESNSRRFSKEEIASRLAKTF